MKQRGKVTNEWLRVRKEYLKANPPNHQGYYICANCGKWIPESYVEVDHIKKRGSHPELRYEHTNLQILCRRCHDRKDNQ